jgi:F0F1-type ATP synthase assembly protein I
MSSATINSSKPICTAVLLDIETVEALQSHLADKDADYNDDNDTMSLSSSSSSSSTIKITESKPSSSSKSKSTAATLNILNFLTGLCTGAMLGCAGFTFLLQHWHSMSPRDIILFGLVWGVVTCVATYLLFNLLLYTGTLCHFGISNSNRSSIKESRKTAAILVNCFGSGTFLGFSGVCLLTDVVQGMATSIIILTVVVASLWACLMVYCAVAAPAEKSEPKAPASKKSSSKSPQKAVKRSPQKTASKAVVPAAISVQVTDQVALEVDSTSQV